MNTTPLSQGFQTPSSINHNLQSILSQNSITNNTTPNTSDDNLIQGRDIYLSPPKDMDIEQVTVPPSTQQPQNVGQTRRRKKAIFHNQPILEKYPKKNIQSSMDKCNEIKSAMNKDTIQKTFLENPNCCKSLFDKVLEIYKRYENTQMKEFEENILDQFKTESSIQFDKEKLLTLDDLKFILLNILREHNTLVSLDDTSTFDDVKKDFCKQLKDVNLTIKNNLLDILVEDIEYKLGENITRSISKYVYKLVNGNELSIDKKKNLYESFIKITIKNDKTSIFHPDNKDKLDDAQNADQVCGQLEKENEPDYNESSIQEIINYLRDKQTISTIAQDFVSHDYLPTSLLTGKLLWMATGTGKTCTALSLIDRFMDADYTVFWILPPKSYNYSKKQGNISTKIGNSTMRAQLYRDMIIRLCNNTVLDYLSGLSETENLRNLLIRIAQSQTTMPDSEVFDLAKYLFKNFALRRKWLGNYKERETNFKNFSNRTKKIFNDLSDNSFILEFDELYTLFYSADNTNALSQSITRHLTKYLQSVNFKKCVVVIDEIHNLVNPMKGTNNSFGYIDNDQVREKILQNMMKYMSLNETDSLKVIGLSATPDSDPSLNGFATLLNLMNVQTPNYNKLSGNDLRSQLLKYNPSVSSDAFNNLALITIQNIDYIDLLNSKYHGNAIPNNIKYTLIDSEVVLAQKKTVKTVVNSLFKVGSTLSFRRGRLRGGKVMKKMDETLRRDLLNVGVGINQIAESKLLYKLDIFNKDLSSEYNNDTQKLRRIVRVYATKVLSMIKMIINEDPTKNHLIYVETDDEVLAVAAMLQAFNIPMITMSFDKDNNEFNYTSGHMQRVYSGQRTFGIYGLEYSSVQKHLKNKKQGQVGAPTKNNIATGYPWIKVKSTNGSKITNEKEWDVYQSTILNAYNLYDPNVNLLNILIINKNNLVGKSFLNTTSMHLLDIPENISDFKQLVGRILRMCGTVNQSIIDKSWTYDMSDIKVDIYMYRSIIYETGQKFLSIRDLIKGTNSQENILKNNLTEFIQKNNSANIIDTLTT